MGANDNIFDSITTGDILNNIGASGVQSGDLAKIFSSINETERIKEEQRRKEQRNILLIAGGTVYLTFIMVIIYMTLKKPKTNV